MAIAKFTRSSAARRSECDSFLRVYTRDLAAPPLYWMNCAREVVRALVEVHDLVFEKLEFTKRDWQSNSVSRKYNLAASQQSPVFHRRESFAIAEQIFFQIRRRESNRKDRK